MQKSHATFEAARLAPAMTLAFIPPMLPSLTRHPPEGGEWIHEIKHDGYRTQVIIEGDDARAFTRNGHDWSEKYEPIVGAALGLPCRSAIIDGEVVVLDEQGRSDFRAMRSTIAQNPDALTFVAFDLIHLNGRDLRRTTLQERREALRELMILAPPRLMFSDHIEMSGQIFFDHVDALCLEGIVSKRKSSLYKSGYSPVWLKTKCMTEGEFIIIGIERGESAPVALLARQDPEGLEYVGGAMMTLGEPHRERFWRAVARYHSSKAPIAIAKRGASWLQPSIKVTARHLKGAGKLRHATITALLD